MHIFELNEERKQYMLKELFDVQQELHNYVAECCFYHKGFDDIHYKSFNYSKRQMQIEDADDYIAFKKTIDWTIKFLTFELKDIEYARLVELYKRFKLYDEIMILLYSNATYQKYHIINVMCTLDDIKEQHIRRAYLKMFVECDKVDQKFKDDITAKLVIEELSKEV